MKPFIKIIFFVLCTLCFVHSSYSQSWQWAARVGGPSTDNNNQSPDESIKGMVTDAQGNVYACGTVLSPAQINGMPITTYGGYNIFIAKFNCQGNLIWYKTAGSTGENKAYDLLLDGSGNVYMTGIVGAQSTMPCYFFDSTITEQTYDLFIAKFDTSGNFKWGRWAVPGILIAASRGLKIALDSYGMINILVQSGPGTLFPGFSMPQQGYYVARFDTSGNINRLLQVATPLSALPLDFKIDNTDNNSIYLIGRIAGDSAIIGGHVYYRIASSGQDLYVVKLDSLGQYLWGIQLGKNGISYMGGFGICKNGTDWAITGTSIDSVVLGSFVFLNTVGTPDKYFPFTALINSSGTVLSASNAHSQYGSIPSGGITTLSNSRSYFTGWFSGEAIFGTDTFPTSNGLRDAFLCEVSPAGSILGATKLDCTGDKEEPQCITKDANDNIFIGGGFDGTLTVNGTNLTSAGGNTDGFIAKYGTQSNCTVGIEENQLESENGIIVYPNLATDILHIRTKDLKGNISISLYNTLGQKSFQQQFSKTNGSDYTINVNQLPAGIYSVVVTDGEKRLRGKIVKE